MQVFVTKITKAQFVEGEYIFLGNIVYGDTVFGRISFHVSKFSRSVRGYGMIIEEMKLALPLNDLARLDRELSKEQIHEHTLKHLLAQPFADEEKLAEYPISF